MNVEHQAEADKKEHEHTVSQFIFIRAVNTNHLFRLYVILYLVCFVQ